MKKMFLGLVLAACAAVAARGQADTPKGYRSLPIIATVQFHSLALPFRDLKSNFANVGFGLGTEVSLNRRHNWVQQASVVWYANRAVGNGLLFYTQNAWRPAVYRHVYAEVKAGAGYLVSFRPVESYKPVDGNWVSVGRRGKGMFTVPVGISVGYNRYVPGTYLSPFASYQVLLVGGYNQSIPVVPQSLVQVGSRIHLGQR